MSNDFNAGAPLSRDEEAAGHVLRVPAADPSKPTDPEFERIKRKSQARIRRDFNSDVQRDRDARVKSGAIEREYHAHMQLQREGRSS